MAPKAGPSSQAASSSRLAAGAPSTLASTTTPGQTPDAVAEEALAVARLYGFFYRGGTAYTYNGRTARRYYCKACLNHEIEVVRAAREQFSRSAQTSFEVLQDIALGRLEYFLSNRDIFIEHLEKDCLYLTPEARKEFKEVRKLLSAEQIKLYQNQYDYGSIYEAVQFPQYAGVKQDIQPGAASPANIFAAHEATLLARARKRRMHEMHTRKRKQKENAVQFREMTETSMSETPAYDSDDFEESQRVESPNQAHWKDDIRLDTSNMYNIDKDPEGTDVPLPSDFPSSDLLKALQSQAGDMYAKRGLMSTETKPKNTKGESLPSMIQAFDGSALLALGVLAEELVKAQMVRPHCPQPVTDFYERKVEKTKMRGLYGYGRREDNELIDRILERLPEGSTVGLASQKADDATLQLDSSDTEMDE